MCVIEKMDDLVTLCRRQHAQGNVHSLVHVIRISSFLHCECGGHAARNANRKVCHTLEETTPWTSVHLEKTRANKAKASTTTAKTRRSKYSKDTKDKIRLNVETVECANIV